MNENKFCANCGSQIDVNAEVCPSCGVSVAKKKSYTLTIVLGYIFSVLGGLIGLILAIYNVTRDDESAKLHGKIQLIIFVVWIIIIAIMFANTWF